MGKSGKNGADGKLTKTLLQLRVNGETQEVATGINKTLLEVLREDMKPNESELPLSLEYARREDRLLAPVTIPAKEAPVKQVIKRGEEANIYDLPVVRHHDQ